MPVAPVDGAERAAPDPRAHDHAFPGDLPVLDHRTALEQTEQPLLLKHSISALARYLINDGKTKIMTIFMIRQGRFKKKSVLAK